MPRFYINNNGSTDNNCSNTVRLNLKGKAGGKFSWNIIEKICDLNQYKQNNIFESLVISLFESLTLRSALATKIYWMIFSPFQT